MTSTRKSVTNVRPLKHLAALLASAGMGFLMLDLLVELITRVKNPVLGWSSVFFFTTALITFLVDFVIYLSSGD